jgi:hypothetical protein
MSGPAVKVALLLLKTTDSLLGLMNQLKTGERLGISASILYLLSFALSHSLLQPSRNQGRTGMIDNTFMTRD